MSLVLVDALEVGRASARMPGVPCSRRVRGGGVVMSTRTPRPLALAVIPENIPQELKDWPQWVVWRYEWKEAGRSGTNHRAGHASVLRQAPPTARPGTRNSARRSPPTRTRPGTGTASASAPPIRTRSCSATTTTSLRTDTWIPRCENSWSVPTPSSRHPGPASARSPRAICPRAARTATTRCTTAPTT